MSPLNRRSHRTPPIEARIRDAIHSLQPLLRLEECGIELLEFRPSTGTVLLRIVGDCPDCNLSAATMIHGIEAHLRMRVPEIQTVQAVSGEGANG